MAILKKSKSKIPAPVAAKTATAKKRQATGFEHVLVHPHITEKTTHLTRFNQYAFRVSVDSNKQQVSAAVQSIFGIKPLHVKIINTRGKKVRIGRVSGKRKSIKKALVTLPKGKTLDIYEGV